MLYLGGLSLIPAESHYNVKFDADFVSKLKLEVHFLVSGLI